MSPYGPRIPTSRKVMPSQYQRIHRNRNVIMNLAVTIDDFVEVMQRASDSMGRLLAKEATR